MSETKICSGPCGLELPLSAQYFDRDNQDPTGFRHKCKQCRSETERLARNKQLIDRVAALDEKASAVLDCVLDSNGALTPHFMEVFEQVTDCYGGARGYAQHRMANYLMSKPGSTTRLRYDEQYLRMVQKVTEMGMAKKPLDQMTDEELENLGKEQAKRFLIYREPIDATAIEHTEPQTPEGGDDLKKVS